MAPTKPDKPRAERGAKAPTTQDDSARTAFTKNVIQALQELQDQPGPDTQVLASRAWDKLQYDWPVLSRAEVDALSDSIRSGLESKGSVRLPPLSNRLVTNIIQAVQHSSKPQQKPVEHLSPVNSTSQANSTVSHAKGMGTASEAQQDITASHQLLEVSHTSHNELAAAYQRLSAVLLLDVTSKVLQLPKEEICQALAEYQMDETDMTGRQEVSGQACDQSAGETALLASPQHPTSAGNHLQMPSTVVQPAGSSHSSHSLTVATQACTPASDHHVQQSSQGLVLAIESKEAYDLDDDDFAYEPLELTTPIAPTTTNIHTTTSSSTPAWMCQEAAWSISTDKTHSPVWANRKSAIGSARQGQGSSFPAPPPWQQQQQQHQPEQQFQLDWPAALRRLLNLVQQDHLASLTVPIIHTEVARTIPTSVASQLEEPDQPATKLNAGTGTVAPVQKGVTGPLSLGRVASAQEGSNSSSKKPDGNSSTNGFEVGSGLCVSSGRYLWDSADVRDVLVQIIRTLGVHEATVDMQPLMSKVLRAYLGLAVDWAAAAATSPTAVAGREATAREVVAPCRLEELMAQVWDALGVTRLANVPRMGPSKDSKRGHGGEVVPILLGEAQLVLGMVVQLASKLHGNKSGHACLWRAVHTHLLPLLDRCLADVLSASNTLKTGKLPKPLPEGHNEEVLRALGLTCQVIDLYLEHRPGGADPVATLQQAGVMRQLSALLPIWCSEPAAEPLRVALLLCCGTSPSALSWAVAVPGVKEAVEGAAKRNGPSVVVAHGVVWQLLLAGGGQDVDIAGAGGRSLRLLMLLDEATTSDDASLAELLRDSIQLLLRIWRACPLARCVRWGTTLDQAMRRTLDTFKAKALSRAASSGQAAVIASIAPSQTHADLVAGAHQDNGCVSIDDDDDGVVSVREEEHEAEEGMGREPVAYSALQVRQWQAESALCLKELLLTSSGKVD